jgi:hypothetical protein
MGSSAGLGHDSLRNADLYHLKPADENVSILAGASHLRIGFSSPAQAELKKILSQAEQAFPGVVA